MLSWKPGMIQILITVLVITALAPPATADAGSDLVSAGSGNPPTGSCMQSLFVHRTPAAPVTGPVAAAYVPPPGVMPVIVLSGSPYEMGYQYGLQAPEYIAVVRDGAWASARSKNTYAEIMDNCSISRQYIRAELPGFDFLSFFDGISDAMNDQNIPFSPDDPVVMLYYGGRLGPGPDEHCTAFTTYENHSSMVAGVNFDYYPVPSNSYAVILALYPDNGYPAIVPSGAGRTGSNAVVNEKGLVYIVSSGPSQGRGDTGPGITGFLELPYVGMTAGSTGEARQFLLNSTRAFALNHLIADPSGDAEVIEATRARYAIRYPERSGNGEYIIATNHYRDPSMRPSQPVWDPLEYYPSSHYRYITAVKEIADDGGSVDYAGALRILSLTGWWDGNAWHNNDPFSTNTINRFRPDVATLYSFVAVPGEDTVSICTGNPGMPYWGTRASGQTGTYVNYTVGGSPGTLVYNLRSDAGVALWETAKVVGMSPGPEIRSLMETADTRYWEGVYWHNRATLEQDRTAHAVACGRAATAFSETIASAGRARVLCNSGQCTSAAGMAAYNA